MMLDEFKKRARAGSFGPGVHYVIGFSCVQTFYIDKAGGIGASKTYLRHLHYRDWRRLVEKAMNLPTTICTVDDDKEWIKDG